MGNIRERRGSNRPRHVFKKRRKPHQKRKLKVTGNTNTTLATPLPTEIQEPEHTTIEGCKIISIEKLNRYMKELALHASSCGGSFILNGETRYGLASILTAHCSTCIYRSLPQKLKVPEITADGNVTWLQFGDKWLLEVVTAT